MIGSGSTCGSARLDARSQAGVFRKILAVFLSVALTVSLAPSAAWAQGAALAGEDARRAATADAAGGPGADGLPGASADPVSDADGAQQADDPALGEQGVAPSSQDAVLGGAGESAPLETSDAVRSTPSPTDSDAAPSPRALAPAANSYVYIQDTQDKDGTSKVTGALETGAVLWANLHDYASDKAIVHEDTWSYQWMAGPRQSSNEADYTAIAGATEQSLTITDSLAEQLSGSYLAVKVTAAGREYCGPGFSGISSYSVPGPVKLAGQVDIYAGSLSNGSTTTYSYAVGDVVTAQAKEKGSSTFIDADKLTYRWFVSADNETFTEVPGATDASLALDEGYEGKHVRCVLSAKIGSSTYTTRATAAIAAAGSVNVSSVTLDKSSKLFVGDTVTAQASAASGDVTADPGVSWSWYRGESAYSTDTKIDGATGNTLAVTESLLGSYIEARADGGYGDKDSSAAGPVVKAGSVELYKVEATGSGRVGSALTAKAYESASSQVSAGAVVDYQWQYATSKTTADSAFKDIPGATEKTYTVGDTIDGISSLGLYLRVKAVSDGTVVSTKKPSYYGQTDVDPIGPVMLEGAYELSSVKLASSGQGMQAGCTVTPTAQVKNGYYESAVPADAKVVYTWWVRDEAGGEFRRLTEGVSATGALTLAPSLAGKQVKVSANALVEGNDPASATYTVLAENEYDLLRVTLSPASGDLFTGDTVTARVQARNFTSTTSGDDVTDKVSFTWFVGDSADGPFVPLGDTGGHTLAVPAAAAGMYLKVEASSGAFAVEAVTAAPVVGSDSLEGAAKKLEASSFKPNPVYGTDTNINDVVEAVLADLGYQDIEVTTKAAVARQENEHATVGVSTAADGTNGDIVYFFMDPDTAAGSYVNYTQLRQYEFTFMLERDGETWEYTPYFKGTVAWDEARVAALLTEKADGLTPVFATGDTADAVTQDLKLPYKLLDAQGGKKSWSSVSWTSSDSSALAISGGAWADYSAKITRTSADRAIELAAVVGISSSGGPATTIEKKIEITIKSDPETVAAEIAELEQKVGANFTYDTVKDAETGAALGGAAVASDIGLPNPRTIGVDGKYYQVTYAASNDAIEVNGWAGNAFRPLPGASPAEVSLTATVTSKANPEITASKTLSFTVAPLEQSALDREIALMDAAVDGYFDAIADGQSADAVSGNLHAFQKAYYNADGVLSWAYDSVSADDAGYGIAAVELEGYDPMGSGGWRLFKSSRPSVVTHENLLVKQPEYNTKVTVSSCLSSERYARNAKRYPDNADFKQLANRTVSATFTVAGTTGLDDPNAGAEHLVSAKVTGASVPDENGAYRAEAWVPLTEVVLSADEDATAWDVFARVLDAAGCTYSKKSDDGSMTGDPYSVTKDGRTLAMSSDWKQYWAFFVNGGYANDYASNTYVREGDVIELKFVDASAVEIPPSEVVVNPDADCPDIGAEWGGFANGAEGSVLENAATPTDAADVAWTLSLLSEEERAGGAYLSSSDPLIIGGKLYVVSASNTIDPETWAVTPSRARLDVVDPATGAVERRVELATTMDSTCRPVYADGIVVIPLAGGYLQAVSAATLETLWVAEGIVGAQSVSTLTVSGGYVYVSTADSLSASSLAESGTIRRFNLRTGALAGAVRDDSTGYYWSGGVMVNGWFVVPDDAGRIVSYSSDLSEQKGSVQASGAPLRATLSADGANVYAVARDGSFIRITVGADGSLTETGRASFAAYSTSTPTIAGGKAYVGGSSADYKGVLAVIDLATMDVQRITTLDGGAAIPAEVKGAPLVSTRNGRTYVYFTSNALPGGLYVYRLGDAQAASLYVPEGDLANYCMASAFAGSDGTLYYLNDSGHLFALKAHGGEDAGDDGGNSGSGGSGSGGSDGSNQGSQVSGGYVPPSSVPLAKDAASKDAQQAEDEDEVAASAGGGSSEARKAASSRAGGTESGGTADGASEAAAGIGVNPWAAAGIALGVAGLVCVLVIVLRSRRNGEVQ